MLHILQPLIILQILLLHILQMRLMQMPQGHKHNNRSLCKTDQHHNNRDLHKTGLLHNNSVKALLKTGPLHNSKDNRHNPAEHHKVVADTWAEEMQVEDMQKAGAENVKVFGLLNILFIT